MKKVIVIPIYKNKLSKTEIISLKQCYNILKNHRIVLIAPYNIDLEEYEKIIPKKYFKVEYFSNHYFLNICGYNKLMLSSEFYQRFLDYDFMLIYQLDCYVFNDQLDYWCNLDFDYIGAPWLFFNLDKLTFKEKILYYLNKIKSIFGNLNKESLNYKVGNGGFSIRNIKKFHTILIKTHPKKIEKFCGNNSTSSFYNEDVFWSIKCKKIKKPSFEKAIQFSLEDKPEIGFSSNNHNLPFGCHAWDKFIYFWKDYIIDI